MSASKFELGLNIANKARTAAILGAVSVAGLIGYSAFETVEHGLHGLEHEGSAAIHEFGSGLNSATNGVASIFSHRSPWRAHINIPAQDTINHIRWPNYTPGVELSDQSSGSINASKTSHTFGWSVVYNNTFKHGNHEKATVGIQENIDINIPRSAILSSREYILAHPTPNHADGILITIDGDKLSTDRTDPVIPKNQQGKREATSTDGPLVRGENLFTDNANDGGRTTNLSQLVEEYTQVDAANAIKHHNGLMESTIAKQLERVLGTAKLIIPNTAQFKAGPKEMAVIQKMPLKVRFVNNQDQPINAGQIKFQWPVKMGAHPVQEFAQSIGYTRNEVHFQMIGKATLTKQVAQEANTAVQSYKLQENG
jgi:hypothetical protein